MNKRVNDYNAIIFLKMFREEKVILHNRIFRRFVLVIAGFVLICSFGIISYNAKADSSDNTSYAAESTDGGPDGSPIAKYDANYSVERNAYANLMEDLGYWHNPNTSTTSNPSSNINTQTRRGTRSNTKWYRGVPKEFGNQVAWISKYRHTGTGDNYYTRSVVWPGYNHNDGNQYGLSLTTLYFNKAKQLDRFGNNRDAMSAYNPYFSLRNNKSFRIISGNDNVNDDLNEAEYKADLKSDTNYSGYNTGNAAPYNPISFNSVKFNGYNHLYMWKAEPYWKHSHLWWKYKYLGTFVRTIYHTWNTLKYALYHTIKYNDGQQYSSNNKAHNKCMIYSLLVKHNSSASKINLLLGSTIGNSIDPFSSIKLLFRRIPEWVGHKVIHASHHWPCKHNVFYVHKGTNYVKNYISNLYNNNYLGKATAFVTDILVPFSDLPFDVIKHGLNPILMAKGSTLNSAILDSYSYGKGHTAKQEIKTATKAKETRNILHKIWSIRHIDHKGFMKGALKFIGLKLGNKIITRLKAKLATKLLNHTAFNPNDYYITNNINK